MYSSVHHKVEPTSRLTLMLTIAVAIVSVDEHLIVVLNASGNKPMSGLHADAVAF